MNITDHIVSLLKSGTTVELNGIGAFVVKTQDAYLDESSNTFYPKKQTIEFQPYSEDKGNIVQFIAKKECVGEETAAKIWKNYYDALVDKTRTQSYVLPEIGILSFNNGAFAFEPSEELNLAAESTMSQPLTDVEKYSDTAEDDPFAVFDNPEPVEEQPEIPQEESETTPSEEDSEPETETETETEPVQNPELVTETAENADAEPGDEAVESEPVPEATPVPIPLGTESNEPQKPEENTQEPATEQPVEPTAESAPLTETETNAEPTPVPNPETETETETEQSSDTPQPEPVADTESPNNEEKETQSDNIAEILDDEPYTPAPRQRMPIKKYKVKKKTDIRMLIILLLVLLLLLWTGAALYYFFVIKKGSFDNEPKATVAETTSGVQSKTGNEVASQSGDNTSATTNTEPSDNALSETSGTAPLVNVSDYQYSKFATPFTYDASLVEITNSNAIPENRNAILNRISNRLKDFLRDKQYSNATEKMNGKLSEFIDERLDEKLNNTDGFHISKFLTYNDFVGESINSVLQERKQKRARYEVINEIFSNRLLSQYLQELINAGEVTKDVIKAPPAPVYTAPLYSSPKQGFDIIAGTYRDKQSAMKLASSLRSKGAGAYVIERGGLYYVSAGSAPSRTAADKVMFQLKTWYTSNLSIKQW